MTEYNNYLRYAIEYDGKGKNLPLNMPSLCPICMSPEIAGKQKLSDSLSGRKYIAMPLCSEHYHVDKVGFYKFLAFPILAAILIGIIYSVIRDETFLFLV